MAGIIIKDEIDLEGLCAAAIAHRNYSQNFFDAVKTSDEFLNALHELQQEFISVALASKKMTIEAIETTVLTIFCKAIVEEAGANLCGSLDTDSETGLLAACRAAREANHLPEPVLSCSESPAELHASAPSLQEKSKSGQAISPQEWLTEKDLKDILTKIDLYMPGAPAKQNPIKISIFNSATIKEVVTQAQKDHADGDAPYKIPLLLNTHGNHWVNALITVNAANNLTISVNDSLGIDTNKQAEFAAVFTTALPNTQLTFNMLISVATQTDGWSCGYRAVTNLLQDPLFENHQYLGNIKEQLNPTTADGLKSSEQLRDGIFELLTVTATIRATEQLSDALKKPSTSTRSSTHYSSDYLKTITKLLANSPIIHAQLPLSSSLSDTRPDAIDAWKTYLQAEIAKATPPTAPIINALSSSNTIPAAPEGDYQLALQLQLQEIESFKQQFD